MDELRRQIKNTRIKNIHEFNSKPEYEKIRQLYRLNFDKIVSFIEYTNPRLAIEDISNIDKNLGKIVMDNRLLLIEINTAINQQELTSKDIH